MVMIIIDGYISDTFNQATPKRRPAPMRHDSFWVTTGDVAMPHETVQKTITDRQQREEDAKKPKTERTYHSGGLTIFY